MSGAPPTSSSASPSRAAALSWSGGKDSVLALAALEVEGVRPAALVTTITSGYERVSMHWVRRELIRMQAESAAIPLVEVPLRPRCPNDVYEARWREAFASRPELREVEELAFGDLFLADIRDWRERLAQRLGRRASFPIWGRRTDDLAREFIDSGFEATVVCVDPARIDRSFAGRTYAELLAELPDGVDPCGENGEFHTFVHAGPTFRHPLPVRAGEVIDRDGFAFCDLRPGR